jgi:hypothetical protein
MADLKHVGRLVSNKRKVAVAFRTLPGDPYSALVIPTESLTDRDHDALIRVVESNAGQTAYELAEALDRASLPETADSMLAAFHKRGVLVKVSTKDIEMVPNASTNILLSELNQIIADQRGIGLEDLTVKPNSNTTQVQEVGTVNDIPSSTADTPQTAQSADTGVLSDEDLASQYRSQADALFKEAKRLREEAETLSPTKKKSVGKKTT